MSDELELKSLKKFLQICVVNILKLESVQWIFTHNILEIKKNISRQCEIILKIQWLSLILPCFEQGEKENWFLIICTVKFCNYYNIGVHYLINWSGKLYLKYYYKSFHKFAWQQSQINSRAAIEIITHCTAQLCIRVTKITRILFYVPQNLLAITKSIAKICMRIITQLVSQHIT